MTTDAYDPTQSGTPMPPASVEIRLSRNETETLCAKAARGGGMSWGHAEEAGYAAGWLSSVGIDGAAVLLARLRTLPDRAWADLCPIVAKGRWTATAAGPLCPIATGSALADFAELEEGNLALGPLAIDRVGQPVLILPFAALIAGRRGRAVAMEWDGGVLRVAPEGYVQGDAAGLARCDVAALRLSLADAAPDEPVSPEQRPTARGIMAGLNALAMKTTVPPSERSRADAGSGASDND